MSLFDNLISLEVVKKKCVLCLDRNRSEGKFQAPFSKSAPVVSRGSFIPLGFHDRLGILGREVSKGAERLPWRSYPVPCIFFSRARKLGRGMKEFLGLSWGIEHSRGTREDIS